MLIMKQACVQSLAGLNRATRNKLSVVFQVCHFLQIKLQDIQDPRVMRLRILRRPPFSRFPLLWQNATLGGKVAAIPLEPHTIRFALKKYEEW